MSAGADALKVAAPAPWLNRAQIVLIGRVVLGVGLMVLWELGARAASPLVMSPPSAIAQRLVRYTLSGEIFVHTGVTLLEAIVGLTIGTAAGVVVPLVLRLSPRLTDAALPYIRAAMGIPKLALAPLFMLWFGIGLSSKYALIAMVVFFLVFEPTFAGLRAIDRRLEIMARILGANEWQVTRKIVWSSTVPFVFAALRTALPFSLNAAVVGEFISGDAGLGFLINRANDMGDLTGVFAGVVVVTVLVVALDLGLMRVRSKALQWQAVDSRSQL